MIAGAIVALAAIAALFVLAPLRRPTAAPAGEAEDRLGLEEEATRQALRDIELDRATGKLSDDDYAELRARAEARTTPPPRDPAPGVPGAVDSRATAGPSTRDGGSI